MSTKHAATVKMGIGNDVNYTMYVHSYKKMKTLMKITNMPKVQ